MSTTREPKSIAYNRVVLRLPGRESQNPSLTITSYLKILCECTEDGCVYDRPADASTECDPKFSQMKTVIGTPISEDVAII